MEDTCEELLIEESEGQKEPAKRWERERERFAFIVNISLFMGINTPYKHPLFI